MVINKMSKPLLYSPDNHLLNSPQKAEGWIYKTADSVSHGNMNKFKKTKAWHTHARIT